MSLRNAHEINYTSCSLSRRERAGVRGYKWSSYFMHVPKSTFVVLHSEYPVSDFVDWVIPWVNRRSTFSGQALYSLPQT